MVRKLSASRNLTRAQVKRIFGVGAFAYCHGRPLNELVTIHFKPAGVARPREFISRFLKQANDWSRRNTARPSAWLWVLENPPIQENGSGGLHTHILIHTPFHLISDFRRSARRWIELAGGTNRSGVFDCRSVHHCGPRDDHGDYLCLGLLGLLRYLSKGIAPQASDDFGIRPDNQGPISGKRYGYSESLGERRRWLPMVRPGIRYSVGPDSARRRFARAVCPALFEFPPYTE